MKGVFVYFLVGSWVEKCRVTREGVKNFSRDRISIGRISESVEKFLRGSFRCFVPFGIRSTEFLLPNIFGSFFDMFSCIDFLISKIFQSWWISVERKIVKIISKLVFNSESKSKFEFWNLELFVGSVIIFVHKQTLYFQVLDFFKVEIRRGYSKSLQTLNSSNQSASKGCSCPRMIVSRLIS